MPAPQTNKSHAAYDVLTHFVITPIFFVNAIASIWVTAARWPAEPFLHLLWIAVSFALILLNLKTRIYALRNQDRLIRLEERLRLAALLPASEHASIHQFTTSQLIAFRFAPDGELPGLARRASTENLTAKQIKEAINTWQPDFHRI